MRYSGEMFYNDDAQIVSAAIDDFIKTYGTIYSGLCNNLRTMRKDIKSHVSAKILETKYGHYDFCTFHTNNNKCSCHVLTTTMAKCETLMNLVVNKDKVSPVIESFFLKTCRNISDLLSKYNDDDVDIDNSDACNVAEILTKFKEYFQELKYLTRVYNDVLDEVHYNNCPWSSPNSRDGPDTCGCYYIGMKIKQYQKFIQEIEEKNENLKLLSQSSSSSTSSTSSLSTCCAIILKCNSCTERMKNIERLMFNAANIINDVLLLIKK